LARRLFETEPRYRRLLHAYAALMVIGLVFLLAGCALVAWHLAVGPVPRWLIHAMIATGFVAGTLIFVASLAWAYLEQSTRETEES